MIYLDHAASTPVDECALTALTEAYKKHFANPSSSHRLGREASEQIELTRQLFLDTCNAKNNYHFIFTSSATEANNTILRSLKSDSSHNVFISNADHPSITAPIKLWTKGSIREIPLDQDGVIDAHKLLLELNSSTRFINLTFVNNHSGSLNPVVQIAEKIKAQFPQIHIHVDAAQGFSKFPLNLSTQVIDSVALSSQKMGGPRGISGLYLHKKAHFEPLLVGGGHEMGLRASTTVAPLIISWGVNLKYRLSIEKQALSCVSRLNILLRQELKRLIPEIQFPFAAEKCSPYISVAIFPKLASDILIRHLEEKNIFVAASSACSAKHKVENLVFKCLNIHSDLHSHLMRISISPLTTQDEIETFCIETNKLYTELKALRI